MQVSKYNKFFESGDGMWLAFNCLTGGLAYLTEENYHQVKDILISPDTYQFDTDDKKQLRDNLLKGGFLIDNRLDELDILKVRNRIARFDPNHLRLTILPTLNCNFRCSYCYEARKNVTMSSKTQKELIEFVRKKIGGVKSLTTSWYGGEPLLTLDIIEYLWHELYEICKSNNCKYHQSGIITNGYLLTKVVAKRLKEMNIEMVQVTLDGPRDVHDQRRPLADGSGTFDRIMDNLSQVVDILKVSIRINTDRNNVERVIEVLEAIEDCGLKGRVGVYFARVMAHTKVCANIAGSCFMDQEYSDLEVQLIKKSLLKGFSLAKYPHVKFSYCAADQINSFVVDPSGYLYKCWSDPGNIDETGGHVSDQGNSEKNKNITKWFAWDPFSKKECLKCDILPICMGGCPYLGLKLKTKKRGACENSRFNLLDMLRLYYTNYCRASHEVVQK